MPKIAYVENNFRPEKLAIIATANQIIEDYRRQGYTLTLRQLYYQFVSRALIPNSERSYKNLGTAVRPAVPEKGKRGPPLRPDSLGRP
jgi:hypothetical protein